MIRPYVESPYVVQENRREQPVAPYPGDLVVVERMATVPLDRLIGCDQAVERRNEKTTVRVGTERTGLFWIEFLEEPAPVPLHSGQIEPGRLSAQIGPVRELAVVRQLAQRRPLSGQLLQLECVARPVAALPVARYPAPRASPAVTVPPGTRPLRRRASGSSSSKGAERSYSFDQRGLPSNLLTNEPTEIHRWLGGHSEGFKTHVSDLTRQRRLGRTGTEIHM